MAFVQRTIDEMRDRLKQWVEEHPYQNQSTIVVGGKGMIPAQILEDAVFVGKIIEFLVQQGKRNDVDPFEFIDGAVRGWRMHGLDS